jgi:hypothetical protein
LKEKDKSLKVDPSSKWGTQNLFKSQEKAKGMWGELESENKKKDEK